MRAWRRGAIPKSTRPPPSRGPQRRSHRPTARPGREPCLTGLSLVGYEPADFRLATASGTNEYRDRPGLVPRHSRPAPRSGAAGVRMSVGCGSSSAWGREPAPALDRQAGSPRSRPPHRCCDPGEKASKKRRTPVAGAANLSGVRRGGGAALASNPARRCFAPAPPAPLCSQHCPRPSASPDP